MQWYWPFFDCEASVSHEGVSRYTIELTLNKPAYSLLKPVRLKSIARIQWDLTRPRRSWESSVRYFTVTLAKSWRPNGLTL